MSIKDYKNCNVCDNRDVCVRWKSLKVWIRDEAALIEPVNFIKAAAKKIEAGNKKASDCPKYDRASLRNR